MIFFRRVISNSFFLFLCLWLFVGVLAERSKQEKLIFPGAISANRPHRFGPDLDLHRDTLMESATGDELVGGEPSLPRDIACPAGCSCEYSSDGEVVGVDCANKFLKEIPALPSTSVKVQLQNNLIREIPCTKLRGLEKLKELNLWSVGGNMPVSIYNCSFCNLTSLEHLWLGNCGLSSLPNRVFDSLHRLKELDLSQNSLSEITPHLLTNMQSLITLDLSANALKKIRNNTFQDLRSLKVLSLEYNQLKYVLETFEREAFHGLASLRSLAIGNNQLVMPPNFTYPDQALAFIPTLEILSLDGYPHQLGAGFSALKNLTHLSFTPHNSYLDYLPENFFSNIATERPLHLSMSYSFVKSPPALLFKFLPTIYSLDLTGNEDLLIDGFEKVSEGLKDSSLTVLNLTQIVIPFPLSSIVKNTTFQHLKNTTLKVLILETCRLKYISPQAVLDLPRTIEYASIRDNLLLFSASIVSVSHLIHLKTGIIAQQLRYKEFPHNQTQFSSKEKHAQSCTKTSKRRFPKTEKKVRGQVSLVTGILPSFKTTLGSTDKDVDPYFCDNPIDLGDTLRKVSRSYPVPIPIPLPKSLEVLYASDIKISYDLPMLQVGNNRVLKYIDLAANSIKCFGGPLYGVHSVEHIDLSKNFCFKLSPFFFSEGYNVRTLLLGQNILGRSLAADISGRTFSTLKHLETLDLSENVVEDIPTRMFKNNINLQILNLSRNALTQIQADLSMQTRLQTLDLSSNLIEGFSEHTCLQFHNIKNVSSNFKVDIAGNTKFLCSCDYLFFLNFLVERPDIFTGLDTFKCSHVNGTSANYTELARLVPDLTRQCLVRNIFVEVLTVFFLLTGALAIFSLYHYKRWQWKYLFYVGRSRLHIGSTFINYRPAAHAFVTYDQEDLRLRRMIRLEALPRLHNLGITTLLGELDFCGSPLGSSIAGAVTSTHKTLVFLTKDIFKDFYRQTEVNLAIMHEFYLRRPVLVPVLMLDYEALPVTRPKQLRYRENDQPCSLDTIETESDISFDLQDGRVAADVGDYGNVNHAMIEGGLEREAHMDNFPSFMDLVNHFPPEISAFLQGQVDRCLVYTGDTEQFWLQLRDLILEQ